MNTFSIRPKGQTLARYVRALIVARGNSNAAVSVASAQWGEDSDVAMCAKAAVAAGSTTGWADDLTHYAIAANDFLEFVAPRTIIGKLANLRRVPPATRVPAQTSSASAGWIGEGKGIAVSALAFESLTLEPMKCGALAVFSDQIGAAAQPDAESLIRSDLGKALVRLSDETFCGSGAASAIAPAGIAHGAPTVAATGNAKADLEALIDAFEGDLDEATFAMSPRTAVSLSGTDRPDIHARGGSLLGIPVATSKALGDNSSGGRIILIDATRIAFADAGLSVDGSTQGAIQMTDTPTQDSVTPTASTLVSLWQANAVAVRAIRLMNWKTAPGAAAVLTGTSY